MTPATGLRKIRGLSNSSGVSTRPSVDPAATLSPKSAPNFAKRPSRVAEILAVRFASGAAGPRFIELRNSAQNARYASHGVYNGGTAACTLNLSVTRRFTTGQELVLTATQTSGGTLTTDYQGTSITDGFVRLNITLLG